MTVIFDALPALFTTAAVAEGATAAAGTAAAASAAAATATTAAGSVAGSAAAAAATTAGVSSWLWPALSLGSGLVSGFGQIQTGRAQAAAYDANATALEVAARGEWYAGAEQSNRLADQSRRRIASAVAAGAASGVDISSGSPLEIAADLAAQGALEEQTALWQSRVKAMQTGGQSRVAAFQAGQARSSGITGAAGTMFAAGVRTAFPPPNRSLLASS